MSFQFVTRENVVIQMAVTQPSNIAVAPHFTDPEGVDGRLSQARAVVARPNPHMRMVLK